MPKRPLLALVLIVLLPVGLLAWLGGRVVDADRARARDAFLKPRFDELRATDGLVGHLLDTRRRTLRDLLTAAEPTPERLRELSRTTPFATLFFRQAADGRVLHPSPDEPLSEGERDFLKRMRDLFDGRRLIAEADLAAGPGGTAEAAVGEGAAETVPASAGWHAWHWDSGIHLVYSLRLADGSVAGAELSRARLLADLTVLLPVLSRGISQIYGRIALLDGEGRDVLHWGGAGYAPPAGTPPSLEIPLSPPLGTFRLTCHVWPSMIPDGRGGGAAVAVAVAILTVGFTLVWLALYLYREHRREALEATRRVDFVNRVSHELKTPLTNIRLHAELLEERLPDDADAARRVGIIVAEVRRLSRLIGNVLAFSKHRRGRPELRPAPGSPDGVIRETVDSFRPNLDQRGIVVELDLAAPGPVTFDRDALEQILGNLIGNVEKYAASGKALAIRSAASDGMTTVTVADRGPGIPQNQAGRVFEPFERLSDRLTDGVTGAGLGLTIARDLARAHGGDVTLAADSSGGAAFVVRLATPAGLKEETE